MNSLTTLEYAQEVIDWLKARRDTHQDTLSVSTGGVEAEGLAGKIEELNEVLEYLQRDLNRRKR